MRIARLALLVGLVGMCWPSFAEEAKPNAPRFKISKETTYFSGPLRTDGTIDYVEAFNEELSKGVTKENNAAILMLEAMCDLPAPAAITPGSGKSWVFPSRRRETTFRFSGTIRRAWTMHSITHGSRKRSGGSAVLEPLEGRLNLLVEASQRDHYYMPLVREHETEPMAMVLLPHLNWQRQLMNALKARACSALATRISTGSAGTLPPSCG